MTPALTDPDGLNEAKHNIEGTQSEGFYFSRPQRRFMNTRDVTGNLPRGTFPLQKALERRCGTAFSHDMEGRGATEPLRCQKHYVMYNITPLSFDIFYTVSYPDLKKPMFCNAERVEQLNRRLPCHQRTRG